MKKKRYEDELLYAIQELGATKGLNTVFTKFLELTATALGEKLDPVNAEKRKRQYEIAEKGLSAIELFKFAQMTTLLCLAVADHRDDPIDILGGIYHRLKLNNEWKGQFFSPDNLARSMAMMLELGKELGNTKEYEIIREPACGSGVMVIGATWAMQRYNLDYQKKVFFVAQDIDIRCVWMTYIQLTLYKIPAVVIHSNMLTKEEWSHWYTPSAVPFLMNQQGEESK